MSTSSLARLTRRITPVSLACLAALGGTAQAQQVSGTLTYDGVTQTQSGSTISDSVASSRATASYIADADTGVFRVSAAHSGNPGRAESSVTFTQTLTNTSGTDQNIAFSFHVFQGALSARAGVDLTTAGFNADIAWGGSSVWHAGIDIYDGMMGTGNYGATINRSASASDFTFNTNGGWDYTANWADYTQTLGLGILGAGESRTLTYTMSTYSESGPNNFNGYGGAFGFGGDPVSFSTSPVPAGQVLGLGPAAAVPEPESAALLVAGLGVVGAMARRRRGRDLAEDADRSDVPQCPSS